MDVHNKTLGIIGMGQIGEAIAKRAPGFNVHVVYHNRHRLDASIEHEYKATYKTKEALLSESDYIVLSLPFTKSNYHIIGAKELALMKPSSVLINIARGGLIDETALAESLQQKKIAGAALDVFEEEPKIHPGLLDLPNVILTPHIAGATLRAQHGLASVGADNLIAALGHGPHAFHPLAIINPEVLK
jgi:lactate dehydrogenase-like 2-hydroxyacid dehydrogenase